MEKRTPKIVSIASGKGGVGKTFLTANLAVCLVKSGRKVLVVDCDMGLANMDILLGINPELSMVDVIFGEHEIGDIIVSTDAGFDLVPASSGVKEMSQLYSDKIREVRENLEKRFPDYDYVLLDTGAGISESVLQLNMIAAHNIIVLNKEPTSMTDAYAAVKVMHQKYGRENFGIIVNSARSEEEGRRIFEHLDAICMKFLGFHMRSLGYVRYDEAVSRSIITRKILVEHCPESPVFLNCKSIAAAIVEW